MKPALLLLVVAALLGLSGCLPVSQNPLSSPDTAVADARLAGVWAGKSGDDLVFLHFVQGKTAMMDAVEVDHPKDGDTNTHTYTVFPTVIDGVHYLNVQDKKGTDKSYHLARYQVTSSGTLTIWLMSEKPAIKAIESEKISGKVGKKDPASKVDTREVSITASTEHLAAFVGKSDPEVLFGEKFCTFKKLTIPPLDAAPSPTPKSDKPAAKKKKKSGG
ncbi:MAG: hypothetical protein WCD79_21490 [Chthoniobacteraceae bacterium]